MDNSGNHLRQILHVQPHSVASFDHPRGRLSLVALDSAAQSNSQIGRGPKSDTKQPIIEALNSTEIAPTVHKESLGLVADTIDTDSEDGDADDKK